MIKDSNNRPVKHGDTIKTERGVKLSIVEYDDIFYMVNSGNGKRSPLLDLTVEFFIQDED